MSNEVDLNQLELPIAMAVYMLASSQAVPDRLPSGSFNFDLTTRYTHHILNQDLQVVSQESSSQDFMALINQIVHTQNQSVSKVSTHTDSSSSIPTAAGLLVLLAKLKIPIFSLVNHSAVAEQLSNDIKHIAGKYTHRPVFIFNLYKFPNQTDSILKFLKTINTQKIIICILGLEVITARNQSRLIEITQHNPANVMFFIKPCRCGNYLSNNHKCICHPLIRTKILDSLSGELIELFHFAISLYRPSQYHKQIRSDFFFNSLEDNSQVILELLQKPCHIHLTQLDSYLKTYLQLLAQNYSLNKCFITQLALLTNLTAYIRGSRTALFGDLIDVFSLQSNYLKYAKSAKFLHYRPFIRAEGHQAASSKRLQDSQA